MIAGMLGATLMLLVGWVSGQDYNWDLLNYHFASPQLLLSGRTDLHVAPSGLQSWFNPIGYIPAYLAISHLPPWLVSALLAVVAGLNAPLIYLIAARVGRGLTDATRTAASFVCVAIGMSGALLFSEAGTTFLDAPLSIAILGAVLCVMTYLGAEGPKRRGALILVAGLLLGAVCGLKLTNAVLAIGMAGAIAVLAALGRIPLRVVAGFVLGGIAGHLLTGGWWAWRMWETFGNPVFPMFNHVFGSPAAPARATVDTAYLPTDWTGIFGFPWHWLVGDTTPGNELPIFDRRYPFALIASLIVVVAVLNRRRRLAATSADPLLLVALFCLFSYLAWLFSFAILRYLIPLELLSGVCLLAAFSLLPASALRRVPLLLILAAFALALTTRYAAWGRAPHSGEWFGARGIAAIHRPGTVYVLPGDTPLGFMIHSFPDDARFVRVGGTFPLDPAQGLGLRAARMIAAAPYLRSLAAAPTTDDDKATLRRFGLSPIGGACRIITTKTADVESCALASLAAPGSVRALRPPPGRSPTPIGSYSRPANR